MRLARMRREFTLLSHPFEDPDRRPKTAKTLGRKRSQLCTSISTTTHVLSGRAWALSVLVNPAPRLCSLQESEIMLFAGVRARALSGSTPDYPDDEHVTLCGCLCLCVCRFVFVWPSRKGSANELLNTGQARKLRKGENEGLTYQTASVLQRLFHV